MAILQSRSNLELVGAICCLLTVACASASTSRDSLPSYTDLLDDCGKAGRTYCDCAPFPADRFERALRGEPLDDGDDPSKIAGTAATDVIVTNTFMGSAVSLGISGNHSVVWWRASAGALHLYDQYAYGFTLEGLLGIRFWKDSLWSIVTGARFLNVSNHYQEAVDQPAQHVSGELGVGFDILRRPHVVLQTHLATALGVRRALMARGVGAHEVADERYAFQYGGSLTFTTWFR